MQTDTKTTATQRIVSRWDPERILFECEVPENIDSGMAMCYAIEQAAKIGADLFGADLCGSNLIGARLISSILRGADLRGSTLRGADMRDSTLIGAKLIGANLSDANLVGANLRCADLNTIRSDLFDVLLRAPREISGLRAALVAGRVDGSAYQGDCACLIGTIANVRGSKYDALGNGIKPDGSRPIERFFLAISYGDTPENSSPCAIAVQWIDEFKELLSAAMAQGERE